MLVFHLFHGRVVALVEGIVLLENGLVNRIPQGTNIVKDRQGLFNKEVTYERKN